MKNICLTIVMLFSVPLMGMHRAMLLGIRTKPVNILPTHHLTFASITYQNTAPLHKSVSNASRSCTHEIFTNKLITRPFWTVRKENKEPIKEEFSSHDVSEILHTLHCRNIDWTTITHFLNDSRKMHTENNSIATRTYYNDFLAKEISHLSLENLSGRAIGQLIPIWYFLNQHGYLESSQLRSLYEWALEQDISLAGWGHALGYLYALYPEATLYKLEETLRDTIDELGSKPIAHDAQNSPITDIIFLLAYFYSLNPEKANTIKNYFLRIAEKHGLLGDYNMENFLHYSKPSWTLLSN